MKNCSTKKAFIAFTFLAIMFISLVTLAFTVEPATVNAESNGNSYNFSQFMTTKDGSGYADPQPLSVNDPLIGVKVAGIVVSNYSATTQKDGVRYFLKTSPDIPELSIELKTDLDNLGGSGVWISSDGDTRIPDLGYVGKIGYGWLGISHTDYQGNTCTVCIQDVFNAVKDGTTFTPAWFGEEGAYKVCLLFETKRKTGTYKNWHNPFYYTNDPVYGYANYRIDASFEIRNANAQIFAFDSKGNELLNGSICESFSLDFAETHYLNVYIKREIAVNENELMESFDVRYNSVGVDKRIYNTLGLYTIEAYNDVTGARTSRKILVVNPENKEETEVLNKAVATNYSDFATLATKHIGINNPETSVDSSTNNVGLIVIAIIVPLIILAIVLVIFFIKRKHSY